jgi:hypothetical protein
MEDRILTLHPDPSKQGVNIDRTKYGLIRTTILAALKEQGALTLDQLNREVEIRLSGDFSGSIPWYVVTVKLDLEARQVIKRLPGSPHRVELKE